MGKVEVLVVKDCCASPTASVGNLVGINQIRREIENIVQILYDRKPKYNIDL